MQFSSILIAAAIVAAVVAAQALIAKFLPTPFQALLPVIYVGYVVYLWRTRDFTTIDYFGALVTFVALVGIGPRVNGTFEEEVAQPV